MGTEPELSSTEKLLPHPLAEIFPLASRAEYEALRSDIQVNGQQEEIVIYEGKILDGRNRYNACLDLNLQPRLRSHDNSNPLAFVISKNIHRRHLSKSQVALCAADVADLKRGGNRRNKAQICALSHAEIAAQRGVSPRLVDHASALREAVASGRAIPELRDAVRKGNMSVSAAQKLIRLSHERQRELVAPSNGASGRKRAGILRRDPIAQLEDLASKAESWGQDLCIKVEQVAARLKRIGELTPARRNRLAGVCRNVVRQFSDEAKCLEDMQHEVIGMPFEDA